MYFSEFLSTFRWLWVKVNFLIVIKLKNTTKPTSNLNLVCWGRIDGWFKVGHDVWIGILWTFSRTSMFFACERTRSGELFQGYIIGHRHRRRISSQERHVEEIFETIWWGEQTAKRPNIGSVTKIWWENSNIFIFYNHICTVEENINGHFKIFLIHFISCLFSLPWHCMFLEGIISSTIFPWCLPWLHWTQPSELNVSCRPPNAFQPSVYD